MTLEPNTYKPVGMPFGGAQQGMAFAKADTQLRDAVLGAFKKVVADGTYASIIAKWEPAVERHQANRDQRHACALTPGCGG